MIEIICSENLQKEEQGAAAEKWRLPKNIRQVGSPRGRHKIYIEDYVYTYIQSIARSKDPCAAIFFGMAQVDKDIRCTFVSGAVECGAAIFQWDNIQLDDSFWDYIYKEKKQYFPDLEIVGWFLGKGGMSMELPAAVESAHRKYFAGRDKLLLLMDTLEGEEIFYVHEQGCLQKREGYYIYYEKNIPMQEYMVSKREEERQWDRLADWEGTGKGTKGDAGSQGAAAFWKGSSLGEKEETPRKGKFADLYQELQQLDDGDSGERGLAKEKAAIDTRDGPGKGLAQEKAEDSFQSLMQAISSGRKESAAQAKPARQEKNPAQARTGRLLEGEGKSKPDGELEAPWEKIFAKNSQKEPKTPAEEALESYRNMVLERHSRQMARQNRNFLYTAASFFLVILCVMGITTINNYRKMQEVEETLHILKSTEEEQASQNGSSEQEDLIVESVASQVKPLDEEDKQKQAQGESQDAAKKSQDVSAEEASKSDEKKQEASAAPKERARYYTVQPGDTLDSICLSIYNSLDVREELCRLNDIEDGNKIFTGQRLQLP